jgi:phosphatidylinositol alpha-1,6-mannosyltransferase
LVKELVPACQAIEVVPLGTDPDVFKPEPGAGLLRRQLGFEGARVVLSVSRLSAYKGHETIMRAIPLMQSGSALRYVIVGDGPHRQSLETIAERLGIRAQIHFAGRVPDQELVLYYAMADVFALCTEERRDETDVEGFGIVFLEASASGLPIVATNAGGIPDAVADGETGFLVPAGDPAATAIALDRLLLDDQLAAAMGARGRRRVLQHFNWDNTARIVSHHLGSALPRYALSETG